MIAVKDSTEFTRLLEALSNDIVDAHVQYRLHCDLADAFAKFPLVRHQSPAFWSMTLQAHLDSSIHALCRVYDQEERSLHLKSWLLTIQGNLRAYPIFCVRGITW